MRLWGRAFQRTNRASTKNLLLGFETTRPSVIMLTSHKFLRLKGGDFCSPVGRPRCGLPRQPRHELLFLSCSILKFAKMKSGSGDGESHHRPRDTDMLYRVMAVAGIVSSKSVLSLFDNAEMKAYIQKLDPKHSPPHRLERIRILTVLIDAYIRELSFIVAERRGVLRKMFMSGNIGEFFL